MLFSFLIVNNSSNNDSNNETPFVFRNFEVVNEIQLLKIFEIKSHMLRIVCAYILYVVFSIAKKKSRALNHKMGLCKCLKEATFSEKEHFRLAIKLEQTN